MRLRRIFVISDNSDDDSGDIHYDLAVSILIWIMIIGFVCCIISYARSGPEALTRVKYDGSVDHIDKEGISPDGDKLMGVGLVLLMVGSIGILFTKALETPCSGEWNGRWGPPGTYM